jgi:hypothetical protein
MMRQRAIAGFKTRGRRRSLRFHVHVYQKIDVRFTPESGHLRVRLECTLSAKSGRRLPSILNSQVVGATEGHVGYAALLYAVRHRLEGPATKKFISGLPCAATPTLIRQTPSPGLDW